MEPGQLGRGEGAGGDLPEEVLLRLVEYPLHRRHGLLGRRLDLLMGHGLQYLERTGVSQGSSSPHSSLRPTSQSRSVGHWRILNSSPVLLKWLKKPLVLVPKALTSQGVKLGPQGKLVAWIPTSNSQLAVKRRRMCLLTRREFPVSCRHFVICAYLISGGRVSRGYSLWTGSSLDGNKSTKQGDESGGVDPAEGDIH